LDFSGLTQAHQSITKLDSLRRKFEQDSEPEQMHHLRSMVVKLKQHELGIARSRIIDRQQRLEAKEIAQWLTVWLQSPDLFEEWLSLRRRSPEFIQLTS
jgi:hypothetical protein